MCGAKVAVGKTGRLVGHTRTITETVMATMDGMYGVPMPMPVQKSRVEVCEGGDVRSHP